MTRGSLQRQLTLSIVGVIGVALAALSGTLSLEHRRTNWTRFDERLTEVARGAAARVSADGQRWALRAGALRDVDQSRGRTWVQLWAEDGSPLGRSAPDGPELAPPAPGAPPAFSSVALPGGGSARLYRAWLSPYPPSPSGGRVAAAVARDVAVVEQRIARFGAVLWSSTLAVVLLAAAVASAILRRSLRGVARVSASIAAMDASSLRSRLDLRGLPDELMPPFLKLDELLARIEASLARERQFSADVSHELRTPLAGLRAILEVAASRSRPPLEYRASLGEALEVVHELEAIVEDLLLLARLGAGKTIGEAREEIPLRALVDACFAPLAEPARRRGLRFQNRIPPDLGLVSEPVKLRLVVRNLLSNAVEYTAEGGWITVEGSRGEGFALAVRDSGPALPDDALLRIFDPFFRLDPARAGGGKHTGIGLALVRGLCDALDLRVVARNEPDGSVVFGISAEPRAPGGPRDRVAGARVEAPAGPGES